MGRMQLNLLMTFAQFEREMSSDRIRDKVAAMRQRGMWTGGPRPYGYTPKERRLMVAPEEAPIVCRIFKDYVRLASPLMIARNLNAEGIPYRNGKPWTAKTIQRILHNPLYIGKVTHKGETFQGEHEALISETLWQQANDTRGVRVPVPSSRKPNVVPLLRGKLFCASCRRPMHHSLHQRGKRTYRYYVCHSTCAGDLESDRCKVSRLPADLLEREICALLQAELKQPELVAEVARESKNPNLKAVQRAVVNPVLMKELPLGERHRLMELLVRRIEVSTESVTLVLDGEALTGEEGAEEVVKTLPSISSKPPRRPPSPSRARKSSLPPKPSPSLWPSKRPASGSGGSSTAPSVPFTSFPNASTMTNATSCDASNSPSSRPASCLPCSTKTSPSK